MAELIYEQALEALRTLFEGIDGNELTGEPYWYTPATVIRTHGPDLAVLNSRFDTIYALWPDDLRTTERPSFRTTEEARFFLLVARQHPVGDVPHREDPGPLRWTVQNRLIRDAKKRLAIDVTLGDLVDNTELTSWIQSSQTVYITKWAVALARGRMVYDADVEAP